MITEVSGCFHLISTLYSSFSLTEILKLSQENSPQLKETLRSISHGSITSTCLQEALEKAAEKGHVEAVQSIILAGVKESLKFDQCIVVALRFNYVQV